MAANFFRKIPRILYEFEINGSIETHSLTNTSIKFDLRYGESKKLSGIYKFAWLDNLRPDTFAETYYGLNELYWLGLMSGGIYDIHNELPKDDSTLILQSYAKYKDTPEFNAFCITNNFQKGLEEFYLFATQTIHHHEDSDGDWVDPAHNTQTTPVYILSNGITKGYEDTLNESKRYVNIIDSSFGPKFRAEYDAAMNKLQSELEEDQ